MWECPDFFPLGDKHVLIYSTEYITYWEVGTYYKRELRFHSERKGFLDHGAYCAPKTMIDDKGRRLLWGWIQESRPREEAETAGWSGAVSLPRLLTKGSDNQLRMDVPPELASLRTNSLEIKDPRNAAELQQGHARDIVHNRSCEIISTFKAGALDFGLDLQIGSPEQSASFLKVENGVSVGQTPSIIVGDRTLDSAPTVRAAPLCDRPLVQRMELISATTGEVLIPECSRTAVIPAVQVDTVPENVAPGQIRLCAAAENREGSRCAAHPRIRLRAPPRCRR